MITLFLIVFCYFFITFSRLSYSFRPYLSYRTFYRPKPLLYVSSSSTPENVRDNVVVEYDLLCNRFTAALALFILPMSSRAESVEYADAESQQRVSSDSQIVTDTVYLDVKIANYTEESIGRNRGAEGSGRIVIGLFGKVAPKSVENFLSIIDGDGLQKPSFYNTQFSKILNDQLLTVEKVRGINTINIAGSDQYEFNGNLLPGMQPILENNGIRHDK